MKKIILIITVAAVIILIALSIWFFAFSGNSRNNIVPSPSGSLPSVPPVQSQTQNGTSVRVRSVSSPQNPDVAKDFMSQIQNADQIALGGTVVASSYALQIWGDENGGGEALLKYASSIGWTLVSFGGGEWSVLGLVGVGVPVPVAKQLIASLTNGAIPSPTGSPITIPEGDTVTIGTSNGSVVMNNFYKSAVYFDQGQQVVVVQQATTHTITYYLSYSSFIISIVGTPFEDARAKAETAFLEKLGISQKDACELHVLVLKPGQAGTKLSFCTNKVE